MSKIKRFLKMHYKKFVTVLTVFALCVVVLVSQVFAVEYNYKLLVNYRSSALDIRYNYYYDSNNSGLTLDWVIPERDETNNRFVASYDCGSQEIASLRKNIHRFDLIVRFNNDFEVLQGDNFSLYFWLSSRCHFYNIEYDAYPQYRLHFIEVWFGDVKLSAYVPVYWFNSNNVVNDQPFTVDFGTMTSNLGPVTSIHFAFITNMGVNASQYIGGISYQPFFNIWFGDSLSALINRDTSQNPIYTPPNNNSINNHNKIEQGIQEDISGGLDDTNIIFENFNSMSDESRLTRGMLFITQLMSRVFAFEVYDILGEFALAIGLVGFLLGLATLIKNKPSKEEKPHTKENSDSYNDYSRRHK